MTHNTSLRDAIEELREDEFPDIPANLAGAILEVEADNVEERDVAVDEVRKLIRDAARARVEAAESSEESAQQ